MKFQWGSLNRIQPNFCQHKFNLIWYRLRSTQSNLAEVDSAKCGPISDKVDLIEFQSKSTRPNLTKFDRVNSVEFQLSRSRPKFGCTRSRRPRLNLIELVTTKFRSSWP